MTREEEIRQAAYKYIETDAVRPENEQLAFGDFINGIKWADEHPNNPWHKTDDDLPKEGVHYQMKGGEFLYSKPMLLHICEDGDDGGDDYKGYFDGKFWRYWDKPTSCDVVMGKVTHWMLLPSLPK